jgi:PPOX class probable F420-dependent enzyme
MGDLDTLLATPGVSVVGIASIEGLINGHPQCRSVGSPIPCEVARVIRFLLSDEAARTAPPSRSATVTRARAGSHSRPPIDMPEMSAAQRRAFLQWGTRTAMLATTRPDGRPHVAPVWFVLDGDDLVFTTGANTVKGRSLRRDGRVCMAVDDPTPPFAFVMVEGLASISTDPDALLDYATRIGRRYMGDERAEEYGRRNGVPGELLVRVAPTRIVAQNRIAD